MAKWSEKMMTETPEGWQMRRAGKAVDTWDTCPYCNCIEGQMHDKFCRTQIGTYWEKVIKPTPYESTDCFACGEGTCEHAAPDNDVYNITVREGYYELFSVLRKALDQAQSGKGSERHGNGQPFTGQPVLTITRSVGRGFPLGQAMKKIQESQRMEDDAAKRELLGAINYLAAAILSFDE